MDVRVFPFAFPPIKGGAQGGDSPTPTPPPMINAYDFSGSHFNVSFATNEGNWTTATGASILAALAGVTDIIPTDVTNVASVEIACGFTSITADGVEMLEDTDFSNLVGSVTVTGSSVAMTEISNRARGKMNADAWNSKMAGKAAGGQIYISMTAFDNNGNTIQKQTWTALVS